MWNAEDFVDFFLLIKFCILIDSLVSNLHIKIQTLMLSLKTLLELHFFSCVIIELMTG